MAVTVTHNTAADGTFSASGAAAWDEAHAVSGLGTMAEASTADYAALAGATFTGPIVLPLGSTSAPSIQPVGGGGNDGLYFATATNPGFVMDGVERHRFGSGGLITNLGGYSQGSSIGSPDVSMIRAGASSWVFGSGVSAAGGATSRTEINKTVTGISDNVATTVFTVTIPNAAHTATIEFDITGIIGAGGAVGAHEAAASASCKVVVTRTAGLNAVASAVSTVYGSVAANVTGATTATLTLAVSAISGGATASNTFTLTAQIARAGGSSSNHIALGHAKLMNANASGITIA